MRFMVIISVLLFFCVVFYGCEPGYTEEETLDVYNPYNLPELSEEEALNVLAFCVSDSYEYAADPIDMVLARYEMYKSMGVKSMRVMVGGYEMSLGDGAWRPLLESRVNYLVQTVKSGLKMKLKMETLMAPPNWLANRPGARLQDQNGRESIFTISYWYPDIIKYTESAMERIIITIRDAGLINAVAGVCIDFGPAGEPLYPPAWTQISDGLDGGNGGPEVFWCYGDNAQADFREKMSQKYGTIQAANSVWNTNYDSFNGIDVPKPGILTEDQKEMWRDVLVWYRDTKRDFIEKQIQAFMRVSQKYTNGKIKPIIYIPGTDVRDDWFENAVNGRNDGGNGNVAVMCDSRFLIEMAKKYNCYLQYTGASDEPEIQYLRAYAAGNGAGTIPMFGENAGVFSEAKDPGLLVDIIKRNGLAGIDYTHTRFLFESDRITPSAIYNLFETAMQDLTVYINN